MVVAVMEKWYQAFKFGCFYEVFVDAEELMARIVILKN